MAKMFFIRLKVFDSGVIIFGSYFDLNNVYPNIQRITTNFSLYHVMTVDKIKQF